MILSIPNISENDKGYLLRLIRRVRWLDLKSRGHDTNYDTNSTNHVESANAIFTQSRLKEKDFYSLIEGAICNITVMLILLRRMT